MEGLKKVAVAGVIAAALAPLGVLAQQPVKIGFVMFLSGPAASPFGVPAKNAADFVVDELNAGKGPAPYGKVGFGGSKIEMVQIDEAGPTTSVVTEYRNLVQRSNVDLVIGYISSGNCLAIAPVAEELKKFTNFFDCGTPRIFEDASYKYVFRTSPTATMDSVGAAYFVRDTKGKVKSIAGVNQNYAWGQDSWGDFEASMKQLDPGVEVKTSQMPKLFAGQYGAEISALLGTGADVIHSSFWDGDLEALHPAGVAARPVRQAALWSSPPARPRCTSSPRRFPTARSSARAVPSALTRRTTPTTAGSQKGFEAKFNAPPNYASYQMAQAILGVKAAWEKAHGRPTAASARRTSRSARRSSISSSTVPAATVRMAIGKGHQAIMETAYGMTKNVGGKLTMVDVKRYPAEAVNPPEGVKSADWIKSGFKK